MAKNDPISEICDYVALHSKRYFARVVELGILKEEDYPGSSGKDQYNSKVPMRKVGGRRSESEKVM